MNKSIRFYTEKYLTKKISAEIKCCLTFFLILCFYCVYKFINGFTQVTIIHMLEMVWVAYIMQWVQVLIHSDFDEVDNLSIKEWLLIVTGSFSYAFLGYLGNWFDKSIQIGIAFWIYMVCCYLSTFLVYKFKRVIDAKHLNEDLLLFQERRLKEIEVSENEKGRL